MGRSKSRRTGADSLAALGDDVRVATYTRRSTDDGNQPYTIDAQDTRLSAYVASQPGWRVVRKYSDDASGATTERPELKKAMAAAQNGLFDVLLVYRVDRFSRNLRDMVVLLDDLDEAGVIFRSATEPFDTSTPMGRMLVQMLGMFAQFERDTIIDRVIAGMERKAAKGKWKGGKRPFGYRVDPATHVLVIDEHEAAVVRTLFDLYTTNRTGARSVASTLNDRGHRTTTGGLWSGHQVLRALSNRTYLGELTFRGHTVTGSHEPIIDTEQWERAQTILQSRAENPAHRAASGSDYMLTGRIRCHRAMVGTRATGRSRTYRYYTCWNTTRYNSSKCDFPRLDADAVDNAILDSLASFYRTQRTLLDDAINAARKHHQAAHTDRRAELDTIDAELAKTNKAIDRYLAAFESGTLDDTLLAERLTQLRTKTTQLRTRHDELTMAMEDEPQVPESKTLDQVADAIGDIIRAGNHNQAKALIEALIDKVTIIAPDRLVPVFRVPTTTDPQPIRAEKEETAPEGAVRIPTTLVELRGLEPLTPTLPVWCATSCAIAPDVCRRFPGCLNEVTPPPRLAPNRLHFR